MDNDGSGEQAAGAPRTGGKPPTPIELCEQQGFKYAAFISWPHEISARGNDIASKLAQALDDSFRSYARGQRERVCLDTRRLQPGYRWDPTIRADLCHSVVMIAILVPTYFDSEYCSIEWGIATALERRRLSQHPGRSCFIPIRLVPKAELNPPSEIGAVEFDEGFEDFLVWGDAVETHPRWRQVVEDLRKLIFEQIRLVCLTPRDWTEEEKIAMSQNRFQFTWPVAAEVPVASPFVVMRSVERR